MTESSRRIIELINAGKTANEIADALNISNKVLYNRLTMLRSIGYTFNKDYYYNGNIKYDNPIIYGFNDSFNREVNIITDPNMWFDFIALSDLHFGSICERPDLLYSIYDYCAKEGIHTILIAGDLIDGVYGYDKKIEEPDRQMEYFVKNYPFDRSIINYCVLGDHDYNAVKESGRNFAAYLNNYRQDIVPLGYYQSRIIVQDDSLYLFHGKRDNYWGNKIVTSGNDELLTKALIIKGHSHQYLNVNLCGGNTIIKVPPFCDIKESGNDSPVNAVRVKIRFSNFVISNAIITPLIVSDKVVSSMEINTPILSRVKIPGKHKYNTIGYKK